MPTQPQSFQIPNLPGLCGPRFTLRANKHCRVAGEAALAWTKEQGVLDEQELAALAETKIQLLASVCFATCDAAQLVLVTEFLALLVHWWDRGWDERGAAVWQQVYSRICRTTNEAWQARFQETLRAFQAAQADARQREAALAGVDAYLAWRRQSSGLLMGLALIEYAEGLDIPDTARNSEPLKRLSDSVLDIVIWMHDIASYNIQQAADDKHNGVAVMMSEKKIPLQAAVNAAGEKVRALVEKFVAEEGTVAQAAERDVRTYIVGLKDWIIGTAHWVYQTDRYFRGKGNNVKTFGWVFLLPRGAES